LWSCVCFSSSSAEEDETHDVVVVRKPRVRKRPKNEVPNSILSAPVLDAEAQKKKSGQRNSAAGKEFEAATRAGLVETAAELGFSATCTSKDPFFVYKDDSRGDEFPPGSAGDVDGYLTIETAVRLADVLPEASYLNRSAVHDRQRRLRKGTLLIYEAKTSWLEPRDAAGVLRRKDKCFEIFWRRAGRPPVLVIFLFGGLCPDADMWQNNRLEGVECQFLTPENTVFAWATTGGVYSWASDVKLRRSKKTTPQAPPQRKDSFARGNTKWFSRGQDKTASSSKPAKVPTKVLTLPPPDADKRRQLLRKLWDAFQIFVGCLGVTLALLVAYDALFRCDFRKCAALLSDTTLHTLALRARCALRELLLAILDPLDAAAATTAKTTAAARNFLLR